MYIAVESVTALNKKVFSELLQLMMNLSFACCCCFCCDCRLLRLGCTQTETPNNVFVLPHWSFNIWNKKEGISSQSLSLPPSPSLSYSFTHSLFFSLSPPLSFSLSYSLTLSLSISRLYFLWQINLVAGTELISRPIKWSYLKNLSIILSLQCFTFRLTLAPRRGPSCGGQVNCLTRDIVWLL